jgi:hypothetical protein
MLNTTITVPEIELERRRIGKNLLVHKGPREKALSVEVHHHRGRCYLLKDVENYQTYLKLPMARVSLQEGDLVIRCKSDIQDISELNADCKLVWENSGVDSLSRDPNEIKNSWRNGFNFKQEDTANQIAGLRLPQLGAIHAIASHWTAGNEPATIVMPTGTGKTETMIAAMLYCQCKRILLIVPSDALRFQIFEKFCTLGCLPEIGVVPENINRPRATDHLLFQHSCHRKIIRKI